MDSISPLRTTLNVVALGAVLAFGYSTVLKPRLAELGREEPSQPGQAARGKVTYVDGERYDEQEIADAAKLKPAKDPVLEEAYRFRLKVRQAYNNSRFDELEQTAAELRASKEVFRNGAWKISEFYYAMDLCDGDAESLWQLHNRIHQEWVKAKPNSITAHVAYAGFLTSYAWNARGSGYADTVTRTGWQLFTQRIDAARTVVQKGQTLPEEDPVLYTAAATVALAQGWPKPSYDALIEEGAKLEPKFWPIHTARAYSLLPRWHGEKGDWEAYAAQAAALRDGLGDEVYARIVLELQDYHGNIFRSSRASWPKTKAGLKTLLEKFPDSLEILSKGTLLAASAQDRATARDLFERLQGRYMPSVWRKPERFTHCLHWAQTGEW